MQLVNPYRYIVDFIKRCKPPEKITTLAQLESFILQESARICGEAVIKYAQKRLGKAHYTLARTTPEYNQDLITCQGRLQAEVLSDIYIILLRRLSCPEHSPTLQTMMVSVHQQYISTAPEDSKVSECLNDSYWTREHTQLAQLAQKTGITLFKMLPERQNLLPGNAVIFQGQMRSSYIAFLERLSRRANIAELSALILATGKTISQE